MATIVSGTPDDGFGWEKRLTEILNAVLELSKKVDAMSEKGQREKVYDVRGAAKRLGLTPWYTRRLCSLNQLHAERIPDGAGGKGTFRITEEEIQRYIAEGKRRPGRNGRPPNEGPWRA